ncbi:uncharacterized protein LOC129718473 isoform X2 [Wyeomyia smithii]|uniref:uncharacterized protein LOC129718473 isoform X2 n=1 Tax=Wyeomyia smithii TaxID=174621 RepID=UPI0024681BD6|nr:uncharacterized protein LOC129718473 isoform X2 [Wyeomyia smithii]
MQDYYCIVQTLEASRPVITVVPHKWINGQYLLWPPKKAEELMKNPSSKPQQNWTKIPCTVKRKFIPSLAEAEIESEYLSGYTTDTSDIPVLPRKRSKNKAEQKVQGLDLNYLLENNEASEFLVVGNIPTLNANNDQKILSPTLSNDNTENVAFGREDVSPIDEIETVQIVTTPSIIPEPVQTVTQHNGDSITFEQPTLFTHHIDQVTNTEILEKIDEAKAEIVSTVLQAMENISASSSQAVENSFVFTPVSTVEQLLELECKLEDPVY